MSDVSYRMPPTPVTEPDIPPSQVDQLTRHVARALEQARGALLERMLRIGLSPQAGWRIKEELRHSVAGTEWILSPIHLRELSPELEVRVRIDPEGRLLADGAA
jgi:hypothetical protein